MSSPLIARLAIVCAACLFSTGGAAIKGTTLSAMQVSSLRSGIAALVLALVIQPWQRRLPARVWLVGAGYAAVVTLFVAGNKLTTSAHTIYLQSTAPVFVIGLSAWCEWARPARRDLVSAAALLAGIALLIGASPERLASAPNPGLGNLLALLSGLCWAVTVMGLSRLARSTHGADTPVVDAAFAGNIIACVAGLPFALPVDVVTTTDLWGLAYLGVFQVALAYLIMARGMRELGAIEVSLLLLVEPLANPFWAWWLHGETLAPVAIAGCALILCASAQRAFAGH